VAKFRQIGRWITAVVMIGHSQDEHWYISVCSLSCLKMI
jgi:hypothetical protein